jgi:hypothetical protein
MKNKNMKTIKTLFLLIGMLLSSAVSAQTLKSGIYASDPNVSVTTYVEQKGDVIHTLYAGKYETKYFKNQTNNFVSESGNEIIVIASDQSYTISYQGKTTTISLLLELPFLDKKLLTSIDLPTGGKGYITQYVPFNITGSYQFDGSANVATQFNSDGTGKYQYAESSDKAGQLFNIKWGIMCNDAGQHLAYYRDGVASYTLMIYTTKWEAVGLQYAKNIKRIVVNRDRFKDN